MSRLFRESPPKPYVLGFVGYLFSFLVFLVCYGLGCLFGVVMILLGLGGRLDRLIGAVDEASDEEYESLLREEID